MLKFYSYEARTIVSAMMANDIGYAMPIQTLFLGIFMRTIPDVTSFG